MGNQTQYGTSSSDASAVLKMFEYKELEHQFNYHNEAGHIIFRFDNLAQKFTIGDKDGHKMMEIDCDGKLSDFYDTDGNSILKINHAPPILEATVGTDPKVLSSYFNFNTAKLPIVTTGTEPLASLDSGDLLLIGNTTTTPTYYQLCIKA
jgi:hypothetical protein